MRKAKEKADSLKKIAAENKRIHTLNGMQLFSKAGLGKILHAHRQTIQRNITEWNVQPVAKDENGRDLFEINDYYTAQQRAKLSGLGDEKFGGYVDALEWKTALDAQRTQLKLNTELGLLVNAFEAEMEIASCFSDTARHGDQLLDIVENTLHPAGEDMQKISQKFRQELRKYYERVMQDTEHC